MAEERARERVSIRRWLGFVLGSLSVIGPALASPDRPSRVTGWALLIGSSIGAGLLTQSTLDEVTSKPGRTRRRVWRSLTRRELLAWVLVLVVMAGCGSAAAFAVPWGWRTWRGCAEAVPVPVQATPSLGLPLQDVAAVWMSSTTGPGGCPKYAVQVSTAPDQAVLAALSNDWPAATPDQVGTVTVDLGPAPLVWFPDDYLSLNQAQAANPGLITRKQFYAGSAFGAVMSSNLQHSLGAGDGWTWRGVAAAASRRQVHLVRPQPSVSALGRLAARYLRAGAGPVAGPHPGPDDTAVAQAMCERSNVDQTVFVVSRQAFTEARAATAGSAPPGTNFGCWPDGELNFVSLTPDKPTDWVGIDRAVALLDQPARTDRPSTSAASAQAAAHFLAWLQGDQGQQQLYQADFTRLPGSKRAAFGSGGTDDVAAVR